MLKRMLILGLCLGLPAIAMAAESSPVGRKVNDFSLPDVRTGKNVALADLKGAKAVVVIFLGTACPVNNLYLPRLEELVRDYADKGVRFIGINSNHVDLLQEAKTHAEKYNIAFPVLKDDGNKVADQFDARRTPEAYLLDAQRVIRYRGKIDDQYGVSYRRWKPTQRPLVEALDAVLAGKTVAVSETEAVGCVLSRAVRPSGKSSVTYAKHVAGIMQKHCQECHRPGQIGPMPLLTYKDVSGWAGMIREVVSDRRMPPWFADSKIGHFLNDRTLPKEDYDTLLAWIDQGCPPGNESDAPPVKEFADGWRIGKPDVVFKMKESFQVPGEMPRFGVPYQYFVVETNFKEDMWIERAEARPGAPEVVHHIIAFVLPPANSKEPLPPGPPVLPPVMLLAPETKFATVLCGTAPGDMPTILSPGYARKIPAGSKIVFQMHYTPNGKAQKDQSSIGLIFAKKPPVKRVMTVPIFNQRLNIPPGEPNYRAESYGPLMMDTRKIGFAQDCEVLGFMPHMHVRGKDFFIEKINVDGSKEPLLSIPRYDFNWQNVYRLVKPLKMEAGSRLHCVAHYDNSDANPNNPDPTRRVLWGDQTWQEMFIGWTDIATDIKNK